jgi:hypothetical protein
MEGGVDVYGSFLLIQGKGSSTFTLFITSTMSCDASAIPQRIPANPNALGGGGGGGGGGWGRDGQHWGSCLESFASIQEEEENK